MPRAVRIDLHTHSNVSDGTQTPTELIEAAAAAGLDVVGLTDHDTCLGWEEAQVAADRLGLTLVRGIEISTKHRGQGVHLLCYGPDPSDAALNEALDAILDGRNQRTPSILSKLNGLGIEITLADVRAQAGATEAAGRPHVADALVAMGVVSHRNEAFARYLNPGRPAYVNRYAPELAEMLRLGTSAGGVCVIAHPWGRHGIGSLTPDELAGLVEHGLAGLEVDHQDHAPQQREELRAIAGELALIVTGSSDHHGAGKIDHDLGCNTTEPEQYERLMASVAERSQRRPND